MRLLQINVHLSNINLRKSRCPSPFLSCELTIDAFIYMPVGYVPRNWFGTCFIDQERGHSYVSPLTEMEM